MYIILQAEDILMRSKKIGDCMLVAVILIDKRVGSFNSFFIDSFYHCVCVLDVYHLSLCCLLFSVQLLQLCTRLAVITEVLC